MTFLLPPGIKGLSSYDQRTKSYSLYRKLRSKKCAKNRCQVCDYITDADTFTSTVTGESFKINHQLNCDERCVMQVMSGTIYWGNYG